jgi:hypothetical protein
VDAIAGRHGQERSHEAPPSFQSTEIPFRSTH